MKKSFIIIAAAALILAACAGNDTLNKEVINNSENNGAIGFTSFTEKVTKAENSEALYTWTFFDHQESFLVWARKYNQPKNNIFDDNGTKVSVKNEGSAYKYTYAPDRYWDKVAESYHFYAAAPAEGSSWSWKFVDEDITSSATIDKGYFKIEDDKFSLNGVNLQSVENEPAAQATLKNSFKSAVKGSAKDVDLLIAAPCQVENSYYNKANPDAVNLNFIHILSKLNVTISTALPTTGDNKHVVDLLAFEVKNVPNTGSFNEKSKVFTVSNKQIRWTLKSGVTTDILTGIEAYDATTYTIDGTKKVEVPFNGAAAPAVTKKYIVESLIIPQAINYERVALDAKAHDAVNTPATYYTTWEEYTQAKPIEGIDEAEFNAIIEAQNAGTATPEQLAKIEKTKAVNIAAFAPPTQPYFSITYAIDGEVFIANYNLAAAFMNYNNNSQKWANDQYVDLTETDATTFDFYEGWQNTLNIIINPASAAIQFTADVAEWSDNANAPYEIEKGNE